MFNIRTFICMCKDIQIHEERCYIYFLESINAFYKFDLLTKSLKVPLYVENAKDLKRQHIKIELISYKNKQIKAKIYK